MHKAIIRILGWVHYHTNNSQIRLYNIFKTFKVNAEALNKLIILLLL